MTDFPPHFPPHSEGPSGPVVEVGTLVSAVDIRMAEDAGESLSLFGRVLRGPLLGLLWIYRQLISPALRFASGPSGGCRFHPTCSHYAEQAIRRHGPGWGLLLAARRLLRCTPFHQGGVDLVPLPGARHLRCVRPVRLGPPS